MLYVILLRNVATHCTTLTAKDRFTGGQGRTSVVAQLLEDLKEVRAQNSFGYIYLLVIYSSLQTYAIGVLTLTTGLRPLSCRYSL